jgi:hypothetical protein
MKRGWSRGEEVFIPQFPPRFIVSSRTSRYSYNDSHTATLHDTSVREPTMNPRALIGIAAAALLMAGAASAQQPAPQPRDSMHMQARMGDTIGMMSGGTMRDVGEARLDSLVQSMNHATGNRKVQAMAVVINELVAERRAMHEHMRQVMGNGGKMGGPPREMTPDSGRPNDAPADTAGHAEHHES